MNAEKQQLVGIAGKPRWLKSPLPSGENYHRLEKDLRSRGLATVCQEAKCPNIGECWEARTATIMILGDTCTRGCRFCHVKTGNPKGFVNEHEIGNSVEMVQRMALRYVVITSVDRDDLPDHGSGHFARVVEAIHDAHSSTKVEVLVPDFAVVPSRMHRLAQADPFVVAQNLETVERLTHPVRDPRAGYHKSLEALEFYKIHYPHLYTKSSLMVGLGESWQELSQAMDDLRDRGVDIITFGQYLRPTMRHLPVQKYYRPKEFEELKEVAYGKGFKFVASGPLVRSSYKASDFLDFLESEGHDVS